MSATQPNLGQAALKRRSLTKLIFYPPATPTVGMEAGNIPKWSRNDKRERAQSMSNDLTAVAVVVAREDVHTLAYGYKFDLDEWTDLVQLLLSNSLSAQSALTQTVASGATTTITGALPGRTYDLGKRSVSSLVLTITGPVTLIAGVDYVADLAAGQVRILSSANTDTNPAITCTYNVPVQARRKFTAGNGNPTLYGSFVLFEYDQMSSELRAEHQFSGNIVVTSMTGETEKDFRAISVEVTVWGSPVVIER